jgi:transcriptional regulator with XRE-family HTH domain
MDKKAALRVCGPTQADAARNLGITPSAVAQWPNDGRLPESAEKRVLAFLAEKHLPLRQMLGEQPQQDAAA